MPKLQPRHADALRILNKLRDEYLSTKESLQLVVELTKLGDDARAAIEGQESRLASIEAEITRLTSSQNTLASDESIARARAEEASRAVAALEARSAALDLVIEQKTAALATIVASMEQHKKVLEQV